jgi:hypothetical protein
LHRCFLAFAFVRFFGVVILTGRRPEKTVNAGEPTRLAASEHLAHLHCLSGWHALKNFEQHFSSSYTLVH